MLPIKFKNLKVNLENIGHVNRSSEQNQLLDAISTINLGLINIKSLVNKSVVVKNYLEDNDIPTVAFITGGNVDICAVCGQPIRKQ